MPRTRKIEINTEVEEPKIKSSTKQEKAKTETKSTSKTTSKPSTSKKTSASTTARNTKTSKTVKKQAKDNDDRIKKIIEEQINGLDEIKKEAPKKTTTKAKSKTTQTKKKIDDSDSILEYIENIKTSEKIEKKSKVEEKVKSIEDEVKKTTKKTTKKASKNVKSKDNIKIETVEPQNNNSNDDSKKNINKKVKFDPQKEAQKIETIKKLPKEEKNNIRKNVFINLLVGITVLLYLIGIGFGFTYFEATKYESYLEIASMSMITITIIIFEAAYTKDSGKIAIYGIEFLILSMITLGLNYVKALYNEIFLNIINYISLIFTVYYLIKSLVINVKAKKEYQNGISDIKELVEE